LYVNIIPIFIPECKTIIWEQDNENKVIIINESEINYKSYQCKSRNVSSVCMCIIRKTLKNIVWTIQQYIYSVLNVL